MTTKLDLDKYHYWGFLCGYANASGRNLAFGVANREEAFAAFNQGFEKGYLHGHAGLDGLIEIVLAQKACAFCAKCAAKRIPASGGRTPPRARDVASICGPS